MTDMNVPGQCPLPAKCGNLSCPNRPGEGEFVTLVYEVPRELAEDHHGHRPVEVLVCSPCADGRGARRPPQRYCGGRLRVRCRRCSRGRQPS